MPAEDQRFLFLSGWREVMRRRGVVHWFDPLQGIAVEETHAVRVQLEREAFRYQFIVRHQKANALIPNQDPPKHFFLEEVAAHARVSVATVRHWIRQGELKSFRPGKRRIVRPEDLDAFLAKR